MTPAPLLPPPPQYHVQPPAPPPKFNIYNGVNPQYPGLRVLNQHPPMFCVDQFLTPRECDFLIHAASDSLAPAPVVGQGEGEISKSRTSSTCYLARDDLPDLMRKVSNLTGKPMEHCELPQVGRYLASQEYHQVRGGYDATTD
jgi:prolyl 4-hydroxylase